MNEKKLLDKKRSSKKVESKGLRPHKRATTNDTATTVETIDGERDKGHDVLFIQTPLSDTENSWTRTKLLLCLKPRVESTGPTECLC